jgi:hypothetical protein
MDGSCAASGPTESAVNDSSAATRAAVGTTDMDIQR